MAQTIKELGPENCFLATDRGQAGLEYPAEGLMMFMDAMLDEGLTYEQVYYICLLYTSAQGGGSLLLFHSGPQAGGRGHFRLWANIDFLIMIPLSPA